MPKDLPPGGAVPQGFVGFEQKGEYDQSIAPLFRREDERGAALGMRVLAKHCNKHSIMHGGAMATFLDIAMGKALHVGHEKLRTVTANMVIDYTHAVTIGAWLECCPRVLKRGRRLVVLDGLVYVTIGDAAPKLAARVNGTYAVLEAEAKSQPPQSSGA